MLSSIFLSSSNLPKLVKKTRKYCLPLKATPTFPAASLKALSPYFLTTSGTLPGSSLAPTSRVTANICFLKHLSINHILFYPNISKVSDKQQVPSPIQSSLQVIDPLIPLFQLGLQPHLVCLYCISCVPFYTRLTWQSYINLLSVYHVLHDDRIQGYIHDV